jgi:hypothetical protein
VREALAAIRGLPFAVGPGTVASYLIGHGTAQVKKHDWQSRPTFGVLKHRREDWMRRLLRRMLAAGVLALDPEQQTLHVTRRSMDVISGARANPVRLPPLGQPTLRIGAAAGRSVEETLDGVSGALFERLKAWRRLRADGDGVPAYVICHDATLANIAERKPQSSEELLAVPGMGQAKMQRYGAQIFAELRAHFTEHPDEARTPSDGDAIEDASPPEFMTRKFSEHQLKVRERHARAYERWSDEEDARVVELHEGGASIEAIAKDLERQPNAIAIRMERLELISPQPAAS